MAIARGGRRAASNHSGLGGHGTLETGTAVRAAPAGSTGALFPAGAGTGRKDVAGDRGGSPGHTRIRLHGARSGGARAARRRWEHARWQSHTAVGRLPRITRAWPDTAFAAASPQRDRRGQRRTGQTLRRDRAEVRAGSHPLEGFPPTVPLQPGGDSYAPVLHESRRRCQMRSKAHQRGVRDTREFVLQGGVRDTRESVLHEAGWKGTARLREMGSRW